MSPSDIQRPRFHFTPQRNWINDPNGLIWVDGVWHLFFQYNPLGNDWGNMSWGHAVSPDLVNWRELDVAIRFDAEAAIFSGSVVNDLRNSSGLGSKDAPPLVAAYTSAYATGKQAQSLAVSTDAGLTWRKYAGNPVLDRNSSAFRDPKVFRYGGEAGWWVLVSVEADDEEAHIFTSANLIDWAPSDRVAFPDKEQLLWECPDLFPLRHGGREVWVLVMSVNEKARGRGSATRYLLGDFDGRKFTPLPGAGWEMLDHGRDFYAAATFNDAPEGRRIIIGWMSNWQYAGAFPSPTWRGSMTLPRELTLVEREGRLLVAQRVVSEAAKLERAADRVDLAGADLSAGVELDAGESYRLSLSLALGADAKLQIALAAAGQFATLVSYDATLGQLTLDRTCSGPDSIHPRFPSTSTAQPLASTTELQLDLYVDTTSVELFAADGSVAITDCIAPAPGPRKVRIRMTEGNATVVAGELVPIGDAAKPA